MEKEKLKEYLGIVVDMENNIFLQERMLNDLNKKRAELEYERVYKEPKKPEFHSPSAELEDERRHYTGAVIAVSVFLVICAAFLLHIMIIGLSHNRVTAIDVIAIIAGIGVLFFIIYKFANSTKKLKEEDYLKIDVARKNYNHALSVYEEAKAAEKTRIERICDTLSVVQSDIDLTEKQCDQSKENLKKIYDTNIIFPKYRNLVMVSSLYEYVCTGRCSELEGHEGGYNILEMEIRMDRIITQLDKVLDALNAIQYNQFILYSAIQETNQKLDQLNASTQEMEAKVEQLQIQNKLTGEDLKKQIAKLQESSALTAYHTERVQKELSYLNRMDYLTGRNEGVFYNLPPS